MDYRELRKELYLSSHVGSRNVRICIHRYHSLVGSRHLREGGDPGVCDIWPA